MDYRKHPICESNKTLKGKNVSKSIDKSLIVEYAEHLASMSKNMVDKEKLLLDILNQIFAIYIDPENQHKNIIINPKLNEKNLQELVEKTRKVIISLYTNCQVDFKKGIEIYEKMIEEYMKNNLKEEINTLTREKDKFIGSTNMRPEFL